MPSITEWDFENMHVSSEVDPTLFISSDSTLIAAGPAEFNDSLVAAPLGVVENVGITEGRQVQRIFEIGSSLSYFIVGRALGSLSLGQIFYNGPSLKSALYGAYRIKTKDREYPPLVETSTNEYNIKVAPGVQRKRNNEILPGFSVGTMFSDLYKFPFGLLIYYKDAAGNPVGGIYLERAYITGSQIATTAGAIVIAEGVAVEYTKSIPVEVTETVTI